MHSPVLFHLVCGILKRIYLCLLDIFRFVYYCPSPICFLCLFFKRFPSKGLNGIKVNKDRITGNNAHLKIKHIQYKHFHLSVCIDVRSHLQGFVSLLSTLCSSHSPCFLRMLELHVMFVLIAILHPRFLILIYWANIGRDPAAFKLKDNHIYHVLDLTDVPYFTRNFLLVI